MSPAIAVKTGRRNVAWAAGSVVATCLHVFGSTSQALRLIGGDLMTPGEFSRFANTHEQAAVAA